VWILEMVRLMGVFTNLLGGGGIECSVVEVRFMHSVHCAKNECNVVLWMARGRRML
jgi:hypothetical protein